MAKEDQVHLRTSPNEKELLKKAAKVRKEITGQDETISSTILGTASEYISQGPNKILVDENQEKAESYLNQLESIYLPVVKSIYGIIAGTGIKQVTKEILLPVLGGEFVRFGFEVVKACEADVAMFNSPAAKHQVITSSSDIFSSACKNISKLLEQSIEDRSLTDPIFQEYLSFDENGPFISDRTKEEIRESFKVFIISRKAGSIYKAHQKASLAINEFINSLKDTAIRKDLDFNPWMIISGLFDINQNEGRYEVECRKINYNLLFQNNVEDEE